jgi:hypothetical protein
MPLWATLAAMTVVHTCSSKSLHGELWAGLVTALMQTLVTAEVYVYHMQVADQACLEDRVIAGVCASGNLEMVHNVPTVDADKMCTVLGQTAVEVCCSANCSAVLQTNAPSVRQGVLSVLRLEAEAGKSLCLSPAAVAQGTCFVISLGGIEHPL